METSANKPDISMKIATAYTVAAIPVLLFVFFFCRFDTPVYAGTISRSMPRTISARRGRSWC